jgi:hypothetical protein
MSECIPSALLTPTLVLVHAALPRWVARGHRHSKSRANGVRAEKKSLEGGFEASNNLRRLEISGLELWRFDMVEPKRLGWIVRDGARELEDGSPPH